MSSIALDSVEVDGKIREIAIIILKVPLLSISTRTWNDYHNEQIEYGFTSEREKFRYPPSLYALNASQPISSKSQTKRVQDINAVHENMTCTT